MKKAIKWTLFFILLGSCIASLLCSIIIPEQFNKFIEQVTLVLNYPITIAGVSMTIGGIIAYVLVNFILTNTKFGRKELDNIKNDYNANKQEILDLKNEVINKLIEYKNNTEDFTQECNNKVNVMINQFELLQNNMLSALKTIPNKKVQEIVAKYEEEYETKKAEFIEKAVDSDKYLENKLTDMFKQFMSEVEEKLNEREETTNSQTEEE